jgi:acetolactate synthase-1/2/3 large subunit
MGATDLIHNEHPLYAGRPGITGDRVGNFAMQSCDLLITIGSRLSYKITGYNIDQWAPKAYKIMVDIDQNETSRKTLNIDLPITIDVNIFLNQMLDLLDSTIKLPKYDKWINRIADWKRDYSIYNERTFERVISKYINIYEFIECLSNNLSKNAIVVTTSGNSRVIARQALKIKTATRLITNHNTSPMGYDLPASIGVCIASRFKPVLVIAGDGGINMNIAELQTIVHHSLPIKIFIINNQGYHSIRSTQRNFFGNSELHGLGPDSGDLSFPDYSKISYAYGIPYYEIKLKSSLSKISNLLELEGPFICEVFVDLNQQVQPKVSSIVSDDGTIISGTLENMFPLIDEDELLEILKID